MIKSVLKHVVLALLVFAAMSAKVQAQVNFTSDKYGYSFKHPEAWYIKDKVSMPTIDCKLVDGNGNSFIVAIAASTVSQETLFREIESASSSDISMAFTNPNFRKVEVLERGRKVLNSRTCYYFKMRQTTIEGGILIAEMYMYRSGRYEYSIQGTYFENMQTKAEPAIRQMYSTFRF